MFLLSPPAPVPVAAAHVWCSIKIKWAVLFNHHPGPLYQLDGCTGLTDGLWSFSCHVIAQGFHLIWACGKMCFMWFLTGLTSSHCCNIQRCDIQRWAGVRKCDVYVCFPCTHSTHTSLLAAYICYHGEEVLKWWPWGSLGPVSKLQLYGFLSNIPLLLSSCLYSHISQFQLQNVDTWWPDVKLFTAGLFHLSLCNSIAPISQLTHATAGIKALTLST